MPRSPIPRSPGRSCLRSPAFAPEALHQPWHPGSHLGPKAAFSHWVREHGDKHQCRGLLECSEYAAPRHCLIRANGLGNANFRTSLHCLPACWLGTQLTQTLLWSEGQGSCPEAPRDKEKAGCGGPL